MTVVIANDLPFTSQLLDPLDAIEDVLAFDSRDWSISRGDAWLYGIVKGWPNDGAIDEVAARHGWPTPTVKRLRLLHLAYKRAAVHSRKPEGSES